MRRGTTPTITVEIDADLTNLNVHLALNAGALIVKDDDDLTIEIAGGKTTIECTLTQEDTLAMTSGTNCEVQVRAYNSDGSMAMATTIGSIPVQRIIEDGVLPPADDGGE